MKKINFNEKKVIIFLLVVFFVCLSGCEAFRKKFTRKPKKQEKQIEDIVFSPVEYPEASLTKEESYTNQYLFWRSWHSELINSLYEGANRKKQIDCINEALESLNNMKKILNEEKQKELDSYIQELDKMKQELLNSKFIQVSSFKRRLINLENRIQKNFSYNKVKDYIE